MTANFVPDIYAPQLGLGSGFALFSFRACARGQHRCCVVVRGFSEHLQSDASVALDACLRFARELGRDGGRTVTLAAPGCMRVTPDELSFLAAFGALQVDDECRARAHADWLFGGFAPATAMSALEVVAMSFASHDLWVQTPVEPGVSSASRGAVDLRVVEPVGRA